MAKYKCPQCGNVYDQAGNCSHCNVPAVEMNEEESSAPAAPAEPAAPEQPSEPAAPQQ